MSNASLDSALVGGAVELVYETQFPGDLTLKAQVRYNELAALVTSASSNALKQNSSFGVANASVVFSGPTDWHIASNAIRWLGYAKGTWLPSTDRAILGFNAFAEIGGGLQLIAPNVIRGVQGGTVPPRRSSDPVSPAGWSARHSIFRRQGGHTPVCVGVTRRMDGSYRLATKRQRADLFQVYSYVKL